jgi:GTPase KRas
MRSGDGFICVYSITIDASFLKVKEFYDHVLRVKDVESIPFVIVGNKCDLENQRKVTTSKAQQLATELGVAFLETSAKSRLNVSETFFTVVREIKKWRSANEVQADHTTIKAKKGICVLL